MIIYFRPDVESRPPLEAALDGQDELRFDLDQVRLTSVEVEAMERATDLEWGELQGKLGKSSMRAMRAIVWVLLKRKLPNLAYHRFVPGAHELEMDLDAEERKALREALEASTDVSEMERAAILAQLDQADEAGADLGEPGSKDSPTPPSLPDASATSGISPTS